MCKLTRVRKESKRPRRLPDCKYAPLLKSRRLRHDCMQILAPKVLSIVYERTSVHAKPTGVVFCTMTSMSPTATECSRFAAAHLTNTAGDGCLRDGVFFFRVRGHDVQLPQLYKTAITKSLRRKAYSEWLSCSEKARNTATKKL